MVICAREPPPPSEWPALLPPSTLHHPNLLLLMALSPSADLSGLRLLFEPVWLGSLHVVLHSRGPREGVPGPHPVPGLPPGHLLLQVLEALLFLQARWRAHGGLSSHAVQLVRPGLAKVGSLEHGRPLHQHWLQPRSVPASLACPCPCPAATGSPGPLASAGHSRATPGEAQAQGCPRLLNCTHGCHLSSSAVICLLPPQTSTASASWPRRSSLVSE